ncbi:C40 family peptidase [Clostridium sp.]|uniref:C40 family peptidase n=1 Tax=Clostridium sp. TaxID=1506 RepID=UPI00260A1249|nr:C40 family peptidase [Clostridium sp.]
MKKKILSIVMAGAMAINFATPVFATPSQEVLENQQKYEEINNKIDNIQGKIYTLNEEISPLAEEVENNSNQIGEIKGEIKNTNKEIETANVEISEKEEILGNRLRELYKSGGQSSYIMLLFSSESFSDLISKVDSVSKLVSIDKNMVNDLNDKKSSLNEKITSLEDKSQKIAKLNEETNKVLKDLEVKKNEQETLIEQAKNEQSKFDAEFLSVLERELVSYQLDILNSSNSMSDLKSAISQLRSIRDNQLKSPTIIEEVNNSIETAKITIENLQAKEEAENVSVNRGPTFSGSGNSIVNYAYQFIGTPYVYGATGPSTFDCSGFTSYVFKNSAGVDISRTTYSQLGVGTPVSYNELQAGDLVFTYGQEHVGIYIGNGQYIHAPQPGESVKVSPVSSFYAGRRVLN